MGQNSRKERTGIVVSDGMDKTAVVLVERKVRHKKYSKTIKRSKKFKVHDEKNKCGLGDTVIIIETKPVSKDKCWRLVSVIQKAVK